MTAAGAQPRRAGGLAPEPAGRGRAESAAREPRRRRCAPNLRVAAARPGRVAGQVKDDLADAEPPVPRRLTLRPELAPGRELAGCALLGRRMLGQARPWPTGLPITPKFRDRPRRLLSNRRLAVVAGTRPGLMAAHEARCRACHAVAGAAARAAPLDTGRRSWPPRPAGHPALALPAGLSESWLQPRALAVLSALAAGGDGHQVAVQRPHDQAASAQLRASSARYIRNGSSSRSYPTADGSTGPHLRQG